MGNETWEPSSSGRWLGDDGSTMKLAWLREEKSGPCLDCGKAYDPRIMQFDHLPERGPKLFEINQQKVKCKGTLEELKTERAKCDLVCPTCHALRTIGRRDAITQEAFDESIPPNVLKILDSAVEHGWAENPYTSLVIRLAKPGDKQAKAFFMRFDLGVTATGKRSWRFQGARASNGQPLNYRDSLVYLKDPSVIYPEPPEDPSEGEN